VNKVMCLHTMHSFLLIWTAFRSRLNPPFPARMTRSIFRALPFPICFGASLMAPIVAVAATDENSVEPIRSSDHDLAVASDRAHNHQHSQVTKLSPPETFPIAESVTPAQSPKPTNKLAQTTAPETPTTFPTERLPPPPAAESTDPILEPTPPTALPQTQPESPESPRVLIRQIQVIGSTVFSVADFAEITKPIVDQSVTIEQLRQIADLITQKYLTAGYFTSRAVLTEQTVKDGVVQIQVIEGTIERIDLVGTKRINKNQILKRVNLGIRQPLRQYDLETQLRLLKADPIFSNVEASLREGSSLGKSILTIRVAEASGFFGNVGVDNDSVPSVGGERVTGTIGYRNLTGNGDVVYGSYGRSLTGGLETWNFGYQIPVNPMQGTLQLRIAPSRYRVTQQEFQTLDISGSSSYYDLGFRQPIHRSLQQEFALNTGISHRRGKTLVSDLQIDESVATVLRLGQDWVKRDANGYWGLRSQLNIGTGLLGATKNRDVDGQFVSWTGQAERLQFFGLNQSLQAQLNWQLTPDALPPSQQFLLGGRQTLRGYRQNVRSGDNGVSLSIEPRFTVQRNIAGEPVLQIAPFFDVGVTWNHASNPTATAQPNVLAGGGVGLLWQPSARWQLRLDYGAPLVKVREPERNLQDTALYFGLRYQF
jgi:hemolysin activation/secretion protein